MNVMKKVACWGLAGVKARLAVLMMVLAECPKC